VGCARRALTVTRGELDGRAVGVTAAVALDPDDTGWSALRTVGACVTGCGDGVVCDVVVTGSGRIWGSGSGLGVICANAGEATASAALTTTTAHSAVAVPPSRCVDSRSVLTSGRRPFLLAPLRP
jgi:hypothetical protein